MELIERAEFLAILQNKFELVAGGEGHCVFVSGEAGIGKTALVKSFCKNVANDCKLYQGTCDALFTPRPLAPLYDIAWQIRGDFLLNSVDAADRTVLFTRFFYELINRKGITLIIIEDIHWADEATLDFIKFLARRITQLQCLFILTYRDDNIHSKHPLRNVLGQLNPDSFTRLQLPPLSREAVEILATEKGFKGEDVYSISGGNPFYVNEILASYSAGIPDNIKDSILSVFNRQDGKTKELWEIISVLPTGLEIKYLEKIEPAYLPALEDSLNVKILILQEGRISFKHELYRRTLESSLPVFLRISLNKKILDQFRESFEENGEIERIVHHAKNANEYSLVVQYAPMAAKQAASVGSHIEASRLYYSAIEYYQGKDIDKLIFFYESFAYECYLTNQIREATIYQEKALKLWKVKGDIEKTANCIRFLSRLWWFDGNRKKAEIYADEAMELLEKQPPSNFKAMAMSNMSQLKMLSGQPEECIFWGNKAIEMAKELADQEVLCHALNNVGSVQMRYISTMQKGKDLLHQSLEIATGNALYEHAARAYSNLGSIAVQMKEYEFAKKKLDEGIKHCEEKGLKSWLAYMLSCKARLEMETGDWDEAMRIAENLIRNEDQAPIVRTGALVLAGTIKMRRGEPDSLSLLCEAKEIAFETTEAQRIIPAMVALLEYEWITGANVIEEEDMDRVLALIGNRTNVYKGNEFAFWLWKARKQHLPLQELVDIYQGQSPAAAVKAAGVWKELGCPYEQSLLLFEGNDDDKKNALSIIHKLGAMAIYEKLKQEMRTIGIRKIPRGLRKSTQSNPALLTERELDVLRLLKDGMKNKEIATRLYISVKTVDHHITAILFKLDVNSRAKAVHAAIQREIIN